MRFDDFVGSTIKEGTVAVAEFGDVELVVAVEIEVEEVNGVAEAEDDVSVILNVLLSNSGVVLPGL